jgi:DNA-directed RNA polymerase specialized sigma24 family protein
MDVKDDGSITGWIGDLKSGEASAIQHLWDRYFERLVRLARAKLRVAAVARTVEDEEDAALSAFYSFCRGVEQGRFTRLTDRDDLWPLLVVLTVRKAIDLNERQATAKRGGGRIVSESVLARRGDWPSWDILDRFVGDEPTPEFAAMLAEEIRHLHQALNDDSLRSVLNLRLAGYSRAEIADELGCTLSAVKRKLGLIKRIWLAEELG